MAALLITFYGGLLRLDAFTAKYGTLDHPAWARVMTKDVAPLVRHVRPAKVGWPRESKPYLGGDPINYLRFAREMTTFYQPHVREPVFLATTRAGIWALDGQDAGVSLASAFGSMLAILATYLLGAALISPLGGLAAAAIMAVEYESITWAVDGWRDDLFTATVLLAAWAFLRFRDRPSFPRALLVGSMGGLACLTRITALSFIIPALFWVAVAGPRPSRRVRAEYAAVAGVILTAIVAPFLISCAIATGDPFFAINYHTGYYRFAEGLPIAPPMSAAEYLRLKFARHPIATLDVGTTGLFVRPFVTKWHGLDAWIRGAGLALEVCALAGLAALPFSARGRLLLLMLFSSLLPYALTWNLAGGGEWRFTMHVYAFYIVAAVFAVFGAFGMLEAPRAAVGPVVRRAAIVAAVAVLAIAAYIVLPWYVVREAIVNREDVSVETGGRDTVFYRSGWSHPHTDGSVTVRVSREDRAVVYFPLPTKDPYQIVVRMDPAAPALQDAVTILFNRQLIGRLPMGSDPSRVGSYRVPLPAEWVKIGSNELTLVPSSMVPAGSAGPLFGWLDPADTIGVRLWHVRLMSQRP